jgi:hypothetical protein
MNHSVFRFRSPNRVRVSVASPSFRIQQVPSMLAMLFALAVTLLLAQTGQAQSNHRDHLSEQESEVVRNNQELDKRIDVFVKAVERRFAAINGVTMNIPKKTHKDGSVDDWGEAPKGTRAELLGDIAGLLDEAITNIDNVSLRDPKNPLIGPSVRKLAAAAKLFVPQLEALRPNAKDADELAAIQHALENAQEIMDALKNVPAPVEDSNKKKKP